MTDTPTQEQDGKLLEAVRIIDDWLQRTDLSTMSTNRAAHGLVAALESAGLTVGRDTYLVWSNQHRAWWRANSAGYTIRLSEAGRYNRDEAIRICAHAHGGWKTGLMPPEIPVREEDALDTFLTWLTALPTPPQEEGR